jgi:hypothetical protein
VMKRKDGQILDAFRKSFLTTSVFVRRAYAALESLDADEYRKRARGHKQLIEEILPIVVLLKRLDIPGRSVRCRFVSGNSNHDAIIRVSGRERGTLEPQYFVEVTSAAFAKSHLRREGLTRYGAVALGPEIFRVGDEIVSPAVAVEGTAAVTNAVTWIKERIADKGVKAYPSPCILVVNLEPDRLFTLPEWCEVAAGLRGSPGRSRFDAACIVNWQTNEMIWI